MRGRAAGGGVQRPPVPVAGGQLPRERGEAGGVRGRAGRADPRGAGAVAAQAAVLLPHLRPGRPGRRRLRLPRHQRQRPRHQPRRRRRPHAAAQLLRMQGAQGLPLRLIGSAIVHACVCMCMYYVSGRVFLLSTSVPVVRKTYLRVERVRWL
uniref:Uncharacterized protein n=1 Tax=Triticum urartu TaxID=4572 RepID=A0A8R7R6D0_TRIUA